MGSNKPIAGPSNALDGVSNEPIAGPSNAPNGVRNEPIAGPANAPDGNDKNSNDLQEIYRNPRVVIDERPNVANTGIVRNHFRQHTSTGILNTIILHQASRIPLPSNTDSDIDLLEENNDNSNDDDRPSASNP